MKRFLLAIICVLHVLVSNAQKAKVIGTIKDLSDGKPIELATVVLLSPIDSAAMSQAFSDTAGTFEIERADTGNYILRIMCVGYVDTFLNINITSPLLKNLQDIFIRKASKTLNEVVITATKQTIEIKPDKMVYNVSRDPNASGGTAMDALRKIPGVTVDQDDNISVRGKSGVRIFIDDRPAAANLDDPAAVIRFFPASSIESIEVITNPSSKYDAEGSSAIINIKLKKEKKKGFNGSITAGAGTRNKYNLSSIINFKRPKWNYYLNANGRTDQRYQLNTTDRSTFVGPSTTRFLQDANGGFISQSGLVKVGADYFPNEKNTWGLSLNGNFQNYNRYGLTITEVKNESNRLLSANTTDALNINHNNSLTANLNYRRKLKRLSEDIALDLTYNYITRTGIDSIANLMADSLLNPFFNYKQYSFLQTGIHNIVFQTDYSLPLKGDEKIEAGFKNSYTTNNNLFNFYNQSMLDWTLDPRRSNDFTYNENISAIYADYMNRIKKVNLSGGLRAEHTMIQSNQAGVNQNYISLFPTVNVSYNSKQDQQSFDFTYNRRIDRPPFRMLNGSINYMDAYNAFKGNPNLRPQFSNTFSIGFNKSGFENDGKIKFNYAGITAYASIVSGTMQMITYVDTNRVTFTSFQNLKGSIMYGASAYASASITDWWSMMLSVNDFYNSFSSTSRGNTYNLYMSQSFRFWKNASLELSGFYMSSMAMAQGKIKPYGMVNAGFRKSLLKKKATLQVSIQDVFNTMFYRMDITTPEFRALNNSKFETQVANVSFSWNFSQGYTGDGKKGSRKNDPERQRLMMEENNGMNQGGGNQPNTPR